jgi:hypothetical protein
MEINLCHDCGVEPGTFHQVGCDVERCMNCGGQAISCDCTDKDFLKAGRDPWTGEWPGVKDCREFNLWCKWVAPGGPGKGWVKCGKEDPEAREDLNSLSQYPWSKELRKHVRL